MRLTPLLLCGLVAHLVPLSSAHAIAGGLGMLTVDGIPEEVVFTVGVPSTQTVYLTLRRTTNSPLCHGEVSSGFGVAGPLSLGHPCYGAPEEHTSDARGFDGWGCDPGVGVNGAQVGGLGGGSPGRNFNSVSYNVPWEIIYDGSAVTTQNTWLRIYSDGRCAEHALTSLPPAFYEVARINIQFVSPATAYQSFWQEPSVDVVGSWFMVNNVVTDGRSDARFFVTDNTPQNDPATPGVNKHRR